MTTTQNITASTSIAYMGDDTPVQDYPHLDPQTNVVTLHVSDMADTLASYNRSAALVIDRSDLWMVLDALDLLASVGSGYRADDARQMAANLRAAQSQVNLT